MNQNRRWLSYDESNYPMEFSGESWGVVEILDISHHISLCRLCSFDFSCYLHVSLKAVMQEITSARGPEIPWGVPRRAEVNAMSFRSLNLLFPNSYVFNEFQNSVTCFSLRTLASSSKMVDFKRGRCLS